MKDEILQIFPTPILITKYEEDFSEEMKYVENLKYTKPTENSNFRSINSDLFRYAPLKKINNFCREGITKYTEKILNSKQRLVITQCWTNRNPPGTNHHEHVHPNSIVSGVFYFKVGDKLPPIQFAKDIQSSFKLDPIGYNSVNAETFLLPCVSGELLLFPSNLRHSVPINQGEETRYSMSFNTFGIDIGSEEALTHLDIRSMMNENN